VTRRDTTATAAALVLAATVTVGAAPAAFAQAGGNSFNQLVAPPAPTTPTATATTPSSPSTSSSSSNGGLSTGASFAIVGGAVVLIAAIAFVIMRDAHRAAPVKAREAALAGDRPAPGRAERLRRQRERAKQARRSRKRNR
jgi:hypothetical protein